MHWSPSLLSPHPRQWGPHWHRMGTELHLAHPGCSFYSRVDIAELNHNVLMSSPDLVYSYGPGIQWNLLINSQSRCFCSLPLCHNVIHCSNRNNHGGTSFSYACKFSTHPGLKDDRLLFFRKAKLLLSSAVSVFKRLSPNSSRMIVNCFSWRG